jgi:hypothetical protein
VELTHVGDVERACLGSHCEVLGDDALVLHGHLPAGEGNHPRTGRGVALEEGRLSEGRAHARDNSSDPASGTVPSARV